MTDGGGRLRSRQRQRSRGYARTRARTYRPLPPAQKGQSLWLIGGLGGAVGMAALAATGGLGILPMVVVAVVGYVAGVTAGNAVTQAINRPATAEATAPKAENDRREGDVSARAHHGVSSALTGSSCGSTFNATGPRATEVPHLASAPAVPPAGPRRDI